MKLIFLLIVFNFSFILAQENDKYVLNHQQNVLNDNENHDIEQKEENKTSVENENFFTQKSFLSNFSFYKNISSFLEKNGISTHLNYKIDFFSNHRHGFIKSSDYVDNFDLIVNTDFNKLFNWNNGTLKIHFLGNNGGSICNLVNASQGVSNIEAYPTWKLYQFIFEKNISNNINVAIGLYDLNSEFDTRETASIFINPSHGVGDELAKSGVNGPSIFPNTSLGIRLKYNFDETKSFLIAVLDGVAGNPENPKGTHIIFNKNDGLLTIGEYQLSNDEHKVSFGSWFYTQKSENFLIPNKLENNYGFYLSAEKFNMFSNENLSGFIRIGSANKSTNPVDYYFGSGLVYNNFGFINISETAFATAISHNSQSYTYFMKQEEIFMRDFEVNLELTFSIKLTEWLFLQPDFQFIINPSFCPINKTAFVSGTRLNLKI